MSCGTKKVALWRDKRRFEAVFSLLPCIVVHIAFTFATLLYSQKLAAVVTRGTVAGYETYMGKDSKVLFDEAAKEVKAGRENNADSSNEYLDSRFTIDRLAQLVNSNPKAVSTAINKAYGQNFRSLLNKYRVKEAMLRMSDVEHYGRYTIKAISESVGYKSQSNFIAVFTKLTGIKPNIYQKLAQK